jgi:hypothetical protein
VTPSRKTFVVATGFNFGAVGIAAVFKFAKRPSFASWLLSLREPSASFASASGWFPSGSIIPMGYSTYRFHIANPKETNLLNPSFVSARQSCSNAIVLQVYPRKKVPDFPWWQSGNSDCKQVTWFVAKISTSWVGT